MLSVSFKFFKFNSNLRFESIKYFLSLDVRDFVEYKFKVYIAFQKLKLLKINKQFFDNLIKNKDNIQNSQRFWPSLILRLLLFF